MQREAELNGSTEAAAVEGSDGYARPRRPSPRLLWAVGLGLLATTTSAIGSWIPSLWGDEAASVLSAERSLPSLFRMLGNVDAVHGTYYLFLHFWIDLFGSSPFSVRLPSAFAVGLMVAGVVVLGSRRAGPRAGVIAGIVAVVLPRVTYMGAEARGYAMSAACVVWLTMLLVHIVGLDRPKRRFWLLYAFGLAVCGYVFLFSLLIVVPHAILVLSSRRRGARQAWGKAAFSGVVLAGPVIVYGFFERGQIAYLADRDATNINSLLVGQWFGNDLMATLAWALIVISLIVWAAGWIRSRRLPWAGDVVAVEARPPQLVPVAATWLLAPPAILLGVNAIHPVYSSRYLSFAAPAAALILGWLLARIRQRLVAFVVLLAVIAASSISYVSERTPYAENGSDWAKIAQTIQAHAKPGQGILFDEAAHPSQNPRLAMRTYPASFTGLKDIALKEPWFDTTSWNDSVYPLTSVLPRLDTVKTVWLVEYRQPGKAPDTYDRSTLARHGFLVTAKYPEYSSVVFELIRH